MSRRARIIALAAIMLVAGIAVTVVLVQSGGQTGSSQLVIHGIASSAR